MTGGGMMILPELADKILSEVRKLINEDFIVVNTDGIIIASTEGSRIGSFHEGALIAAKEKRKLVISTEDQSNLKGVKAGINFPIFFQNDVAGVLGITGDPFEVAPFGEIIRKMTELLISESYYSRQFEWQSRAREAFVMDWIQAKDLDNAWLDRARLLSIDPFKTRMAIIIELRKMDQPLSRDIWSSIFSWPAFSSADVVTRWGNNRIVLLLDSSVSKEETKNKISAFTDFIKGLTKITPFAGIGHPARPGDLRQSYEQAIRALKSAGGEKPIVFDEDLTLEMILDGLTPQVREEFINRTIRPILEEQDLIRTLRELFAQNYSLKQTAAQLHIHINTLHYRLKKIGEYTGFDTGKFQDLAVLYLGILILDEQPKNRHIS